MLGNLWSWLDGKKVNIGGIALILTGLGEIAMSYSNNGSFSKDGWEKIVGGWLIIAGRSTAEKIIEKGETK